jgi:hypothetical protein
VAARSLGVDWHLPDGKGGFKARRFATSTVATSDMIRYLAEDGHTAASARDALPYDPEGREILTAFIDAGFGNQPLANFVR